MKKVFLQRPVTTDNEFGVFLNDYTPGLLKTMLADSDGLLHAQGQPVSLSDYRPKQLHYVKGFDLGHGNVLTREQKIIECIEEHRDGHWHVAYTYPGDHISDVRQQGDCRVYYHDFDLTDAETAERFRRPDVNLLAGAQPQCLADKGQNHRLQFVHTAQCTRVLWQTTDEERPLPVPTRLQPPPPIVLPPQGGPTPGQRYPAVVVCLGGPITPIPQDFGPGTLYHELTSRGFYVIIPLRRGVIGISDEWERAIIGDYGGGEVGDIISSVCYALQQQPDIDPERLGLYGGSYGGYTAALIAGRHNGRRLFRRIVIHCGILDLARYPDECHGRSAGAATPTHDPARDPWLHISQWACPTLLLASLDDTSVWFGQAVRAYNKAIELGKSAKLTLIPGPHTYDTACKEALFRQITQFLSGGSSE